MEGGHMEWEGNLLGGHGRAALVPTQICPHFDRTSHKGQLYDRGHSVTRCALQGVKGNTRT